MRPATWMTVVVVAVIALIAVFAIDWGGDEDWQGVAETPAVTDEQIGEAGPVGGEIEGEPIPGADDTRDMPAGQAPMEDSVVSDDNEGVLQPAD